MPKGFFILFFSSLAAKCCINSVAEMLTHQTLLVRNACVLSNRDCFLFWEFRCLFCDKFQALWPQKVFYSYLILNCHHRLRPIDYPFNPLMSWVTWYYYYYYYYHSCWCLIFLLLNWIICSVFFTKYRHSKAGPHALLSFHLTRDICFKGP